MWQKFIFVQFLKNLYSSLCEIFFNFVFKLIKSLSDWMIKDLNNMLEVLGLNLPIVNVLK